MPKRVAWMHHAATASRESVANGCEFAHYFDTEGRFKRLGYEDYKMEVRKEGHDNGNIRIVYVL